MDTGGQEMYKAINQKYYRIADCCLLVYDITDESSFTEIKDYYIGKIKDECQEDVKVILLGNKTDLEEKRKINVEKACSLALKNNFIFKETSCVNNENVADAFETLIEITYREEKKKKQNTSFTLSVKKPVEYEINDKSCPC